jgi:hypothetical protein
MTPPDLFQIRDRLHFPEWLAAHGLTGRGVEIGVLFGEYSKHLLTYWPGHLTLVDPWVNQPVSTYLDGCNGVDMNLTEAKARAEVARFGGQVTILKMFSVEAAATISDGSLDWIFLDANHSFEAVNQDLATWVPKVKRGGIISGHDFYNRNDAWQRCGVKDAVQGFARERDLLVHLTPCTSWFILKP